MRVQTLITRSLTALLLLIVPGCSSTIAPVSLEPDVVPRDASLGEFVLTVEPIPFVATVDGETYTNLCYHHLFEGSRGGTREWRSCDGELVTIQMPNEGGPPLPHALHIGRKDFPELSPHQLAAQLESALAQIGNIRVNKPANTPDARKRAAARVGYIVRAAVTELSLGTEKSQRGFAGGYSVLALFQSENKSIIGFVRLDVMLIDAATGEILMSAPVSASIEYRHASSTLAGSHSVDRAVWAPLTGQATRIALNNAALQIFSVLKRTRGAV